MPAIPPTGDFNKSTIDKDTFHAKFLAVHAYLTGLLGSDGNASTALGSLGVSAFIKTLLDDADAATARTTLGAGDAANITTGALAAARIATALNAAGTAPFYTCRAWVNFNGTGVIAIRASGNVTSVTDNGTGDYTINFTTEMADTNYAVVGAVGPASAGGECLNPVTLATNNVRLSTTNQSTGLLDRENVNVAIFR